MSVESRSLETLLLTHRDRIFRIALGVAGQREDAEDIVQEVLLVIVRNLDRFRGDAALTTWIYRITIRTAVAWLARHRRVGGESEAADTRTVVTEAPLDVAHAVSRLPMNSRTILLLVAVEGFSHGEAARLLDIPEGTVASRLHHARAQLRAMLG